MSVRYRKYQYKSKAGKTSSRDNKWYARPVVMGTVDTKKLSKIIESNVSVKRSDVIAVLAELGEQIKLQLEAGYRVRLDDVGSFKVGMSVTPATSAEDFTAQNIKKMRVVFQPASHKDHNSGRRIKEWLEDATVEELPYNAATE